MKILVLTQLDDSSPGTRVFLEAAAARGHETLQRNPLRTGFEMGLPDDSAAEVDVVFTRMGGATPPRGFDYLASLEARGLRCVNRATPLLIARDKVRTSLVLGAHDLPVPASVVPGSGVPVTDWIDALGAPPWIVKKAVGTKGVGVVRVDSIESLRGVVDMLQADGERFLVQHFLREARGEDVRVLVVGGRAVAAMKRKAAPGDVRANLHQGGSAHAVDLPRAWLEVAEGAVRAVGLEVAGVDLLESADGPMVIEVNGSPGLAGLASVCGDRGTEAILDRLEQGHKPAEA